jgi:chemotaxis protein MotB
MNKYLLGCLAAGVLLASCGTAKKLESAQSEILTLNSRVDSLNQALATQSKANEQLKKENIQYGEEAKDCRMMKESLMRNLEEMNRALAEQGTSFKKIRDKTREALRKFQDAGADAEFKNGLAHITLSSDLLFVSGGTTVGVEGKEALGVVAEVLKENPGIYAYIVGHTDDAKVRSGYKDNWSLSTERANAIVRVLVDSYNVNPQQLFSAGHSKYAPLEDNATAQGKAANRRVEIILNPLISRIWESSVKK